MKVIGEIFFIKKRRRRGKIR